MRVNYLDISAYTVTLSWDIPLQKAIREEYIITLPGIVKHIKGRNSVTLSGLTPGTSYKGTVRGGGQNWAFDFETLQNSGSLNPRDFGALGDGIHDDTGCIQAAISVLPEGGNLVISQGIYLVLPLFLKSNMTLILEEGAVLKASGDRNLYPILPGLGQRPFLGTWEGENAPIYASVISCLFATNVTITGNGVVDGGADFTNWWANPKQTHPAARPRTIFLNTCSNFVLAGITLRNSPSWTLHPFSCKDMKFLDLKIQNHSDSPNTDGLNPEFCENILIDSVYFSVGDDCIALKAGKRNLADALQKTTKGIEINNCIMEKGHGAVVLGSEMSGGIDDVHIHDCYFQDTDRGIRLKTCRGRGGFVRNIDVHDIIMEGVGSAFVFNMYYFCDANGKSDYIQSKEAFPVDRFTPELSEIRIHKIRITGLRICLLFMYGLAEQYISKVRVEEVIASLEPNATPELPAMMNDINLVSGLGFYLRNVRGLTITKVEMDSRQNDIDKTEGYRDSSVIKKEHL